MIDDREVCACANQPLKQHGDTAWFVVSHRADALLAEGQMEGHRTFLRVLARVKRLEAIAPAGQVH